MSGVLREGIHEGTWVMVAIGTVSGAVNNHPPVICLAQVVSCPPTSRHWWLDVRTGDSTVLRLRYAATEILGIPARGLTMSGAQPGEDQQ